MGSGGRHCRRCRRKCMTRGEPSAAPSASRSISSGPPRRELGVWGRRQAGCRAPGRISGSRPNFVDGENSCPLHKKHQSRRSRLRGARNHSAPRFWLFLFCEYDLRPRRSAWRRERGPSRDRRQNHPLAVVGDVHTRCEIRTESPCTSEVGGRDNGGGRPTLLRSDFKVPPRPPHHSSSSFVLMFVLAVGGEACRPRLRTIAPTKKKKTIARFPESFCKS